MSHIVRLQPHSQTLEWVLRLHNQQDVGRVLTCFTKLSRWYRESWRGEVEAVIVLYRCYQQIREVEGYLDREIKRWGTLVARKQKEPFFSVPITRHVYHFPLTNPVQASLLRVLKKLDQLACLTELSRTLLIIKRRFLLAKKIDRHKKSVLNLLAFMAQAKPAAVTLPLQDSQRDLLILALQAEVMPVWSTPHYRELKALTQSNEVSE